MNSSVKIKYDHENAIHSDIIEGYKVEPGTGIIRASIMSPEPQSSQHIHQGSGSRMTDASGMTWRTEQQRMDRDGVTVASVMLDEAVELDGQRDRKKIIADETLNATEISTCIPKWVDDAKKAIATTGVNLVADGHQYANKVRLLELDYSRTIGTEAERWTEVLAPYAPKSSSFYSMRAAACWGAKRTLMKVMESNSILLQGDQTSTLSRSVMAEIEQQMKVLETIQCIKRVDVLAHSNTKAIKKVSKRDDLGKLDDCWQQKMLERAQLSNTYADVISVLSLTGCRPKELVTGITVLLEFDRVVFRITGAKVQAKAAQPWREIDVMLSKVPQNLLSPLQDGRLQTLIKVQSEAALRQAMKQFSRDLWPAGIVITPYHFRHSTAEMLRESGWQAHEIAAVLGERSAETASHYGRKKRPGQRKPTTVAILRDGVRVPFPVAPLPKFDPSSIYRKSKAKMRVSG